MLGVSIWLDDLSRELVESGDLANLVEEHSVAGDTTNPTIFANAIAKGERYNEQLRKLVKGASPSTRWSLRSLPRTCAMRVTY